MPPHPISKLTYAIILAAGRGQRMGRLKQTLPWGDTTVIAHVYDTLQYHCSAGIAVVVGSHRTEIVAALHDRSFSIIQSNTSAQQYESICCGLDYYLNETKAPYTLIQPADHPFIPAIVITALFDEILLRKQQQQPTALIPTFQNKGGHPVLIPRAIAAKILKWKKAGNCDNLRNFQGIKTFWRENPNLIKRIETDEAGIVNDLDTPDDYQQLHP